ncbi:BUD13-like protein [Sciurus carolinensis]|uniref:BUD13 homolog n=1 Tax=Sciurus carolinensis TaxID=30640 RepID=A0AA41MRY8_SCICA|nr:BUD13-like protein [Sciurus carolinensis]
MRMRIVDDDVSWTAISSTKPEKEEEDDGDLPVVAEFVDERPEEVKQMEAFRSSAKWKLLGEGSVMIHQIHLLEGSVMIPQIHLLLGGSVMILQIRLPPEGPVMTQTYLLPGGSAMTPQTLHPPGGPIMFLQILLPPESLILQVYLLRDFIMIPRNIKHECDSDLSPPRKKQTKAHYGDKKPHDPKGDYQKASDSDLSPPRHKQSPGHQDSDSDLSPPRNRPKHPSSDSDLSPPRRKRRTKSSDSDLSPPRRSQPPGKKAAYMYSGAKTGLVLTDIQQEQQELKKQDQETKAFEAEFQFAETVFRDKSGRKRNLKLERLEQRRKAEKDSQRDELYAQWGKGLAQSRQQQQNVEDAMKEMQKPLARYIDDEDLDRMLREQEREGDPMANFIKKNKAKENKNKKVRPRYSGPAPPPNRFNIWPGYRWDGVDRSNGFEQKRFARLASKKAVEELAYKWSVEDM